MCITIFYTFLLLVFSSALLLTFIPSHDLWMSCSLPLRPQFLLKQSRPPIQAVLSSVLLYAILFSNALHWQTCAHCRLFYIYIRVHNLSHTDLIYINHLIESTETVSGKHWHAMVYHRKLPTLKLFYKDFSCKRNNKITAKQDHSRKLKEGNRSKVSGSQEQSIGQTTAPDILVEQSRVQLARLDQLCGQWKAFEKSPT
jgi:hypothetical protein